MLKKAFAALVAVAILGVATLSVAPDAEAKRRCPRGYEDINNVCVPAPNHP